MPRQKPGEDEDTQYEVSGSVVERIKRELNVSRSEKVSKRLARAIVREISESNLSAGTPLAAEEAMAKMYHVGRASVREALRILETQGLIVIRPGLGGGPVVGEPNGRELGDTMTMILQLSHTPFREYIDVFIEMGGMSAAMAARRVKFDGASGASLLSIVKAERQAVAGEISDIDIHTSGVGFHQEVNRIADNTVLSLLHEAIDSIIQDRIFEPETFTEERRRAIVSDHADLGDAIAQGEVALARRLGEFHAERTCGIVTAQNPGLLEHVIDWK